MRVSVATFFACFRAVRAVALIAPILILAVVRGDDSYPTNLFGVNLVTNGNANNGLNGWSDAGNKCGQCKTGFASGHSVFLGPGSGALPKSSCHCYMTQQLFLRNAGIVATKLLAAGRVNMSASALIGGDSDWNDWASLKVSALNGAGMQLESVTLGPVSASERGSTTKLLAKSATFQLPSATNSILLTFSSVRVDLGYNTWGYGTQFQVVLTYESLSVSLSSLHTGTRSPSDLARSRSESASVARGTASESVSATVSEYRSSASASKSVTQTDDSATLGATISASQSRFASRSATASISDVHLSSSATTTQSPSYSSSGSQSISRFVSATRHSHTHSKPSHTPSATISPPRTASPTHSSTTSATATRSHSNSVNRSESTSVSAASSTNASTASPSLSESAELPVYIPIPAVTVASTTIYSVATGSSFVLSSADMSKISMQALLDLSTCGTRVFHEPLTPSRFLTSPFFDYGGTAIAVGNVGAMFVGVGLQYILLLFVGVRWSPSPSTPALTSPSAADLLRVPHWAIVLSQFLAPGAFYGGHTVMTTLVLPSVEGNPWVWARGIAVMMCTLLPVTVAAWVWVTQVKPVARMTDDPNTPELDHVSLIDTRRLHGRWFAFALPTTQWCPFSTRRRYGALFAAFQGEYVAVWKALDDVAVPCLVGASAAWSSVVSRETCAVLHYLLCAALAVAGATHFFFSSHRLPLKGGFSLLSFAVMSITALAQADTVIPRRVTANLSLIQSLVLLGGAAYAGWCEWMTRRYGFPEDFVKCPGEGHRRLVAHDNYTTSPDELLLFGFDSEDARADDTLGDGVEEELQDVLRVDGSSPSSAAEPTSNRADRLSTASSWGPAEESDIAAAEGTTQSAARDAWRSTCRPKRKLDMSKALQFTFEEGRPRTRRPPTQMVAPTLATQLGDSEDPLAAAAKSDRRSPFAAAASAAPDDTVVLLEPTAAVDTESPVPWPLGSPTLQQRTGKRSRGQFKFDMQRELEAAGRRALLIRVLPALASKQRSGRTSRLDSEVVSEEEPSVFAVQPSPINQDHL